MRNSLLEVVWQSLLNLSRSRPIVLMRAFVAVRLGRRGRTAVRLSYRTGKMSSVGTLPSLIRAGISRICGLR